MKCQRETDGRKLSIKEKESLRLRVVRRTEAGIHPEDLARDLDINGRINRCISVGMFIEIQGGQIELVYLPPYAPELNPDEQVWSHAKGEIGKRAVLNKARLQRVLLGVMRSLQKQKGLVRSFLQLPGAR